MKREIIHIDEKLCNGCGACIPGCPEGALQIIDGKARLVSDLFCDGLGACIGTCPEGAITVESREAQPYDEHRVMTERIIPQGRATIIAHLKHLLEHGADTYFQDAVESLKQSGEEDVTGIIDAVQPKKHAAPAGGCPGTLSRAFSSQGKDQESGDTSSKLTHWPIQMHLMNPSSPHLAGTDFLVAADCTAFALGSFHSSLLSGRTLGIACPKLDQGLEIYRDKIIQLIDQAKINTITAAVMEVPCCGSLVRIVLDAVRQAQRRVPVRLVQLSIHGEMQKDEWIS